MSRGIEKSYGWIQLGTVLAIAFLVALGINSFLAARVVDALPLVVPPPPEATEDAQLERPESEGLELASSRNLFNQNAEPDCEAEPDHPECAGDGAVPALEAGADNAAGEGASDGGTEVSAGELPLSLVGTMVATDPRYSSANLKQEDPRQDHYMRVGDTFAGMKLIQIKRNYVVFHDPASDRLEVIAVGEDPTSIPLPDAAEAQLEPSDLQAGVAPGVAVAAQTSTGDARRGGGLQKDASGSWMIDEELVAGEAERGPQVVESMGLSPETRSGELVGYRIQTLASDALFYQVGMRSGDVLTKINGRPVEGVEDANAILDGLSGKGEVVVEVDRRGRRELFHLRRSR